MMATAWDRSVPDDRNSTAISRSSIVSFVGNNCLVG